MLLGRPSIQVRGAAFVMALTALVTIAAIFTFTPRADAHQSGCHRWHSCPSDTGSYVCGDLGYTSGCPGGGTPTNPTTQAASAPAASAPPDAATFVVGDGSGVTFSIESPSGTPSIHLATTNATDTHGLLTGSAYPVVALPSSVASTTYTASLPWYLFTGAYPTLAASTYYWQAYIIDASACVTNACYVAGPIQSFTVAAPPPPPPATPPAAPTTSQSPADTSSDCAADRRRRDSLAKQVAKLRRQIARTTSRSKRARLRRKLKTRRAALENAREAVFVDC